MRALLHAPWSASKVGTALRCPRLFHFRYVERVREPEVMPETRIGKSVHSVLESVLMGTPLPDAVAALRPELAENELPRFDRLVDAVPAFCERIAEFRRRRRVRRQFVEYALAIRDDLTSTAFYAGDAYYRGILDLAYIFDDESVALIDHKTGARIPGTAVTDQLDGYAVLAAAWLRNPRKFWLGVHWIAERAVEWAPPITPDIVAGRLTAGLLDNIEAAALAVDDGPRPNPGSYCDRCSYRSLCPASSDERFEPVEYEDDDD